MPSLHSRLSASASPRWIACAGSLLLAEQCPRQESGIYAAEGTAAHELGEHCLIFGAEPADFLGQEFNGFTVDADMVEAVQVYVNFVRAICPQERVDKGEMSFEIEQRFEMTSIHPELGGTADVVAVFPSDRCLVVGDYKHGKGVVVEPEANSQLMIYALGALMNCTEVIEQVRIVVIQPRAYHESGPVRDWYISATHLREWGETVLKNACTKATTPGGELHTGDHCRFCPAMAVCTAHQSRAIEVAQTEFGCAKFAAPETMSPEHLAKVLQFSELMSGWVQQVKAYCHKQMEMGVAMPGFKLVQKRAVRKWIDPQIAEQVLVDTLGPLNAYEHKPLSVAKAEKALKAAGKHKEEIAELWNKPDTGLVITEESDKRPAVQANALLDFSGSLDMFQ